MNNSAVVTAWGIDAFECLISHLNKTISVEQISRVETFISAYVLYDAIYLNERYADRELVKHLNTQSNDCIRFVSRESLVHSDDMNNHISFDADIYFTAFEDLSKDNNTWSFQNEADLGEEIFFAGEVPNDIQESLDSKGFTLIMLWSWCLANEMAEKTSSVCLLPLSLRTIDKYEIGKNRMAASDYILNKYIEYAKLHQQRFTRITEMTSEKFVGELQHIPPLFSIFLYRYREVKDAVSVLVSMRNDYSEFRELRHKFTSSISDAETIEEKEDLLNDWNRSWGALTAGEFKKPQMLKKSILSVDALSSAISLAGIPNSGAPLKYFLENKAYKNSYKIFRIFSGLDAEIGSFRGSFPLLNETFQVQKIYPVIRGL